MKRIFVIDNYDSFTYNLVHALEEIAGCPVTVKRNDELDFSELATYDYIILSPGPGIPDEAGDLKKAIIEFASKKKILGVCLGHQAIGEAFGASLKNLDEVYHGVQTDIICSDEPGELLDNIENVFPGGRYHSWVIQKESLPPEFTVTCRDDAGEIMGIRHKTLNVHGVQFHPESVLTPAGKTILKNFLSMN